MTGGRRSSPRSGARRAPRVRHRERAQPPDRRCDRPLGGVTMVEMRHEQGAVHAADGYAVPPAASGWRCRAPDRARRTRWRAVRGAVRLVARAAAHRARSETSWYGKGADDAARGRAPDRDAAHGLPVRRPRPASRRDRAGRVRGGARHPSGRPQPAAIEVPIDLQYATGEVRVGEPPPPVDQAPPTPPPSSALPSCSPPAAAGGPAGASCRPARRPSCRLRRATRRPVLTSVEGAGAIPEDHPLRIGPHADLSVSIR